MPNNLLVKINRELGISMDDLEKKWSDAEDIAKKTLKVDDKGFYAFTMGIFKNMLGKKNRKELKLESEEGKLINTFLNIKKVLIERKLNFTAYDYLLLEHRIKKDILKPIWEAKINEASKKYDMIEEFDSYKNELLNTFTNEVFYGRKTSLEVTEDMETLLAITIVNEMTTSGDAPVPDGTHLGAPMFKVPDNVFWKLHSYRRKNKQWFEKFYGTKLGNWAKNNRKCRFCIQNQDTEVIRELESI